jgi:hypothetical protein
VIPVETEKDEARRAKGRFQRTSVVIREEKRPKKEDKLMRNVLEVHPLWNNSREAAVTPKLRVA